MIYIYDGSFEGLLSCIFEVYKTKEIPNAIVDQRCQQLTLLGGSKTIETDENLATRVLTGVDVRTDNKGAALVYKLFLSEFPDVERIILQFVQAVIHNNDPGILQNYANDIILKASQIEKMISREIHRMHAFVRFQKTITGKFYAAIEPDFNVLPLIGEHFERRYADQPWIIFDTKRQYGLYYDLEETSFVTLENPVFNMNTGAIESETIDEKEKIYQSLWESYFQSVNIKERRNPALHLRHVPRRYWKYLIEKTKPAFRQ